MHNIEDRTKGGGSKKNPVGDSMKSNKAGLAEAQVVDGSGLKKAA